MSSPARIPRRLWLVTASLLLLSAAASSAGGLWWLSKRAGVDKLAALCGISPALSKRVYEDLPFTELSSPPEPPGSNARKPCIVVTDGEVLLDGKEVVVLESGGVPPAFKEGARASSFLIEPIFKPMRTIGITARKGAARDERTANQLPAVILAASKTAKYRLLTEILYTVGQAGFSRYVLLGKSHSWLGSCLSFHGQELPVCGPDECNDTVEYSGAVRQ